MICACIENSDGLSLAPQRGGHIPHFVGLNHIGAVFEHRLGDSILLHGHHRRIKEHPAQLAPIHLKRHERNIPKLPEYAVLLCCLKNTLRDTALYFGHVPRLSLYITG